MLATVLQLPSDVVPTWPADLQKTVLHTQVGVVLLSSVVLLSYCPNTTMLKRSNACFRAALRSCSILHGPRPKRTPSCKARRLSLQVRVLPSSERNVSAHIVVKKLCVENKTMRSSVHIISPAVVPLHGIAFARGDQASLFHKQANCWHFGWSRQTCSDPPSQKSPQPQTRLWRPHSPSQPSLRSHLTACFPMPRRW